MQANHDPRHILQHMVYIWDPASIWCLCSFGT